MSDKFREFWIRGDWQVLLKKPEQDVPLIHVVEYSAYEKMWRDLLNESRELTKERARNAKLREAIACSLTEMNDITLSSTMVLQRVRQALEESEKE